MADKQNDDQQGQDGVTANLPVKATKEEKAVLGAALFEIASRLWELGLGQDEIVERLKEINRQRPEALSHKHLEKLAAGHFPFPIPARTIRFLRTDTGNAKRLVAHHGKNLRFFIAEKSWLTWSRTHWHIDNASAVIRNAKDTVLKIFAERRFTNDPTEQGAIAKHAINSNSVSRLNAMITLAQSEPGIPVLPVQLDGNPWLFNVLNGTVDLRIGKLREHRREDLITNRTLVKYDPSAKCPTWEKFLSEIFQGNELLIKYVQRCVGYAMTGDTREQVLFLLYGTGSNGKSTFLEVIRMLLASYAQQTDFTTFLKRDSDGPRNDLAALRSARFVSAVETTSGRKLDEAVVKQVTGGDMITARFLFKEFFEYKPEFKVFLAANHKPQIQGTDHAIWRRMKLIPFEVTIADKDQDKELLGKLQGELSGILNWQIEGCLEWQKDGLGEPEEVREATQEYREEMDPVGDFLAAKCTIDPEAKVMTKKLYPTYLGWCESNDEQPLSKSMFGERLAERGCKRTRVGRKGDRGWQGIALKTDTLTSPDTDSGKDSIEEEDSNIEENPETVSESVGVSVPTTLEFGTYDEEVAKMRAKGMWN